MLDGIVYSALTNGKALGLGQNGGYLRLSDIHSGAEIGLYKVYDVVYDGQMEGDKQDVYITAIKPGKPGQLLITDERGRRFAVELATHRVTAEP